MTDLFATAAAGTEDLLSAELRSLGAAQVRPGRGGVRFSGPAELGPKVCLWSRTAMRVLRPIASFPAPNAEALYDGARAVAWQDHLELRTTFAVEATGLTPTLRHTHFTALKVKDAIVDRMRELTGNRPSVEPRDPDVLVVAHLSRDRCTLSLDLAGQALFRRGYRSTPMKASLKETLAASVLLAAGFDGTRPLVDPMCGAGTLAIEAALIAKNRAPGLTRRLGIERWPSFDASRRRELEALREEARAAERESTPRIVASDRDPEAVAATRMNAARAGVKIEVLERDARELEPAGDEGWIVANPPYGERLEGGGRKQLKTFFWQLGQRWRTLSHQDVAVLAGGPEFESAFGMKPLSRRRLMNGPIQCTLLRYRLG